MKTLAKLKLHNLGEIGVAEQMALRGGNKDIVDGGMIGEVEVVAKDLSKSYNWHVTTSNYYGNYGFSTVGSYGMLGGTNTDDEQIWNFMRGSGGSTYRNGPGGLYTGNECKALSPMQLAECILANPNIQLADSHVSKVVDAAYASMNMTDEANGLMAHTSCYGNAPCAETTLSTDLMKGILDLAKNYRISISEIVGGSHSKGSAHYGGDCIDVNWVNGIHVNINNMTKSEIIAFREAAYAAGAKKVLDPLNEPTNHFNHFHIEW